MDIKNNILETIGNTPLIKLNKITKDFPCTVAAKVDYFNPGNSIKDRMAVKMIDPFHVIILWHEIFTETFADVGMNFIHVNLTGSEIFCK